MIRMFGTWKYCKWRTIASQQQTQLSFDCCYEELYRFRESVIAPFSICVILRFIVSAVIEITVKHNPVGSVWLRRNGTCAEIHEVSFSFCLSSTSFQSHRDFKVNFKNSGRRCLTKIFWKPCGLGNPKPVTVNLMLHLTEWNAAYY